MKQSQEEWVIKQLNLNGFISRNFALQNYISRLGAIICNLTKEGWEFEGKYVKSKSGKNFVYYLLKTPQTKTIYKVVGMDKEIATYK
jgi:hypothetical protein